MKWFARDAILTAIDPDRAVAAIEAAFRDHSAGRVQGIAVGHLGFADPPGDFHVKGAHRSGSPVFAVKIASSFYDNPARGLPSSNGMMLVFDATSGMPLAVLEDQGALTDLRTAIAGGIAARLIARPASQMLGVVGAGTQAGLQARWIARLTGVARIGIWARHTERAEALAVELRAEGLTATLAPTLHGLCAEADLIVTTTPAASPLVDRAMVRPGARIVAVGADAPGKRELSDDLIAAADLMLVDSAQQSRAHGEGTGRGDRPMIELGAALSASGPPMLSPDAIAIADLTGLGAQDAAIAELAWTELNRASSAAPAPAPV